MEYKKIRQAYKIQNGMFTDISCIRALLRILEGRCCDEYPVNYLATKILESEKSAEKALDKCYNILRDIVK